MKITRLYLFVVLLSSINAFSQIQTELVIGRTVGEHELWDGNSVRIFGFIDDLMEPIRIPSPVLEFNYQDSVMIDFWNMSQGAPHTIHLHGMDVDQANDGVPHLSFTVGHMEHGYYSFKVPHPGTYIYHCHVVSSIHVQAGMYGAVIVRPSNGDTTITWEDGYSFDHEHLWLTSEIDPVWHTDSVLNHPYNDTSHHQHIELPAYDPQYFLVNGRSEHQLTGEAVIAYTGESILLRLVNVGFYGNAYRFPEGANALLIASDGRPFPQTVQSDSLHVLPGERYQVILRPDDVMNSQIEIEYFDLNTSLIRNTQRINMTVEAPSNINNHDFTVKLIANPVRHNLSLEVSGETSQLSYTLFNANGIKLMNGVISPNTYRFDMDVSALKNGLYILVFNSGRSNRSFKIIKN